MVTAYPHAQRTKTAFGAEDSTAVLAHEWRNALAPLRAAAQCLRSAADNSEEIRSLASIITDEVDRLDALVNSLLRSARAEPSPAPVSLNAVVASVARAHELPTADGAPRLELDLDPALPIVWADEGLVRQALLNLLRNALEAAGDPGCNVRITTRVPDDFTAVELSVSDNGPGIPPEALERVFDAGYTTKPQGCGIGLAVCRAIVQAHGGDIAVHSAPGAGTVFTLRFPLAHPESGLGGGRK